MTLRARLLLSIAGLVGVAFILTSALVVTVTRANLVDQVDGELLAAAQQPIDRPGRGGPGRGGFELTGRQFAYVLLDRDGNSLVEIACGRPGDPDPLPAIPSFSDAGTVFGKVVTTRAVEGNLDYRLVLRQAPGNTVLALAAPLDRVDQSIRVLVRNLAIVGAAALAAILVAAWFIIRRGLRPLETVAVTADAIASGDLSHRADLPRDRSEVGRMGSAFDRMLDQIQAAFEEQRSSERRLRQFVADASHELRTPLTALRGYSDLYRAGGLADPEALDRAMNRIGTESRRMGSLVEDLLLLARLDQGRPLRSDPVDLSQLVADAVDDARAIEPSRPIAASVTPGVRVDGDEDRLRQVVGNLFANVRVHTPPDAAVEVRLSEARELATLEVADHGPGIEPSHAARVFDRFYRADPGRSRDRGGSGLGLAIAASVVEAHGGTVGHRATPGGGATFVVSLPLPGSPAGR